MNNKKFFTSIFAFALSIVVTLSMFSCHIDLGGELNTETNYESNTESEHDTLKDESDLDLDLDFDSESESESKNSSGIIITPPPEDTPSNEIKNIIIIIGDGMGSAHLTAGHTISGNKFSFLNWKSINVNTSSVDSNGNGPILTDSAAGATAIASGHLTVNNYVGKDHTGIDVSSIMDLAAAKDKSTGIVTTDSLLGATPAAFSGHSKNRSNSGEIFSSQITSGVTLLCGSTDTYCVERKDAIISNGYTYCDDFSSISNTMSSDKVYWQFDLWGTGSKIQLSSATEKALNYLDNDADGFVLMIEQAHIDKYSHNNDFENMVKSALSLNDTVNTVLEWLGDRTDTAILITADHETGGLSVSTQAELNNAYSLDNNTVYYKWSSTGHTTADVKLFTYGFDYELSNKDYYVPNTVIKNTKTYDIMADLLEQK